MYNKPDKIFPRPNALMRIEDFYIEHEVDCLVCGTFFIPAKQEALKELNIAPILANNFCGRECFNNAKPNEMIEKVQKTLGKKYDMNEVLKNQPQLLYNPHCGTCTTLECKGEIGKFTESQVDEWKNCGCNQCLTKHLNGCKSNQESWKDRMLSKFNGRKGGAGL